MDIVKIHNLLQRAERFIDGPLPPGATDAEIDDFTRRTEVSVPKDFRELLKISNGPPVGPAGLYGIRPALPSLDIESEFALFPSWRARRWIPVAGDGCGDYYVLLSQQEFGAGFPVVFVDQACYEKVDYIVASDVAHFVAFLLCESVGETAWPFDRADVLARDPSIAHFSDVPLPWS